MEADEKKFNPSKMEKLNNPQRLKSIPPEYIWAKLALHDCQTIIDIGAGTGLFSRAFYNLMGEGKVYAADISPDMVDWMESNAIDDYLGMIPILMEENSVPLDDETADLILMFNLHHELQSPLILLKETSRLLRQGGKICIVDWKKDDPAYSGFGPALEHRVDASVIVDQLKNSGYTDITLDSTLKSHSLILAKKTNTTI